MKNQLILPMAVYVIYMFCLAVYMFLSRVKAIKAKQVSMKYFEMHVGDPPPNKAIVLGRHYDNQFQVPLLFFITCLAYVATSSQSTVSVVLAWFFIGSRVCHSWIHLGSNHVRRRAFFFAMGWLTILIMWIHLILI